jgi:hypothetical protein
LPTFAADFAFKSTMARPLGFVQEEEATGIESRLPAERERPLSAAKLEPAASKSAAQAPIAPAFFVFKRFAKSVKTPLFFSQFLKSLIIILNVFRQDVRERGAKLDKFRRDVQNAGPRRKFGDRFPVAVEFSRVALPFSVGREKKLEASLLFFSTANRQTFTK